jgi:hypothetical protein
MRAIEFGMIKRSDVLSLPPARGGVGGVSGAAAASWVATCIDSRRAEACAFHTTLSSKAAGAGVEGVEASPFEGASAEAEFKSRGWVGGGVAQTAASSGSTRQTPPVVQRWRRAKKAIATSGSEARVSTILRGRKQWGVSNLNRAEFGQRLEPCALPAVDNGGGRGREER